MEFLPVEVISHILRFLPSLEDRKAASLVCRLWYEAYQSPIFRRDEVAEITSNEGFSELYELSNPNRVFFHVSARGVDINKNSKNFWDRFGPHIRTLSIVSCDFREKAFLNVVLRCDELESLCIQDCRELLMPGYLLESENERVALQRKFIGLKSLNLGYNRYLSDAIFVRFTSICRDLEELLLPGCYISFHNGLYRKFYRNGHSDPSESVFTFPIIFDFLREHATKLKLLSFADTLIDGDAICCIAQINDLILEKFILRGCVQVTNDAIITLSDFQQSLTHLDLALCPRITDLSLLTICSRLCKLKFLSVQGCRAITDLGISDIWRLTELHHLNISECELIRDEGIIKGLCRRKNSNLGELYLRHLGDLTDNSLVQLMEFVPNLRVLDVGYCYNAVTDRLVQAVFSNARYLTNLVLTMCEGFTDRGMTGIALTVSSPPKMEQGMPWRIPLGSKEELKIIRDAKLKQDVQEICESIGLTSDLSGSSLGNLEHLRSLNLSGCNRISDVSLKYAFRLNDLRILDLSSCQQISAEGLYFVCENNRAIESLNLDNCHNVNDEGVFCIFKKLKRLKSLVLGSKQITDKILECFCRDRLRLNFLNVSHCPQLSALTVNKITECHPRLNVVHFSTKSNEYQYFPPPHPPPLINL